MIPKYLDCKVIVIQNSYVSFEFYTTMDIENYTVNIPSIYLPAMNLESNKGCYLIITDYLALISLTKEKNKFVVSCPFIIDRWKYINDYEPIYFSDIVYKIKNYIRRKLK